MASTPSRSLPFVKCVLMRGMSEDTEVVSLTASCGEQKAGYMAEACMHMHCSLRASISVTQKMCRRARICRRLYFITAENEIQEYSVIEECRTNEEVFLRLPNLGFDAGR
jgi:hypothetical protein